MRLLRQLQALEKRRGVRAPEGQVIGLAWVSSDELDPWESTAGLVADVYEQEAVGELERWRLVLRPTEGRGDLGRVYGVGGELVGHVRRVDGSLIEIEPLTAGVAVGAAAAAEPPAVTGARPRGRKAAGAPARRRKVAEPETSAS